MKKIVLAISVLLLTIGLPLSAGADLITYSSTQYYEGNIGNTLDPPSGWDQLTIAAQPSTPLTVTEIPATFNLQSLTFATGGNSYYGWTTPNYYATWNMTVNGATKAIGQYFNVNISSSDTLYLLAATSQYFELESGKFLKVDLLGQTIAGDAPDQYIQANLQIVNTPVPAAVWLLGSGLIGLIGIRRFRK